MKITTQVIKIKIKKRKEKRKITFKGITSGSAEVQKSLKILKKAINKLMGSSLFPLLVKHPNFQAQYIDIYLKFHKRTSSYILKYLSNNQNLKRKRKIN